MTTRAAIYLRISLDAAMDGLAIDRQRQDCEALAEQRGWDVVHTYVDQSISASKKDVDRPDYDAMVASFERGEIDALICWDLDRLTRQPAQLEEWIDRAEEQGLKLVTANGDADLATDGGRMYAHQSSRGARRDRAEEHAPIPCATAARRGQNATKHQHPRRPEVDRRALGNEFAGH